MAQAPISETVLCDIHRVAQMFEDAGTRAEARAKAAHERFNVFTTLLKEHDEVRLHTRFIHCLLDPQGRHDCGPIFLHHFFSTLNEIPPLDDKDDSLPFKLPPSEEPWQIEREVSCPPYGQIDILLQQPGTFGIAIENKIYAAEQGKQLESYGAYLKKDFGTNAVILYLTLTGKPSETHSGEIPYLRISYADHILPWLDKCISESCRIVPISLALFQYRDVVRQLTGKTTNAEAMRNIKTFLFKHPEIISHRQKLNVAIEELRAELLDRLGQEMTTEIRARGFEVEQRHNLGLYGGALLITPLKPNSLRTIPAKVWVEHWEVILLGIKFENTYRKDLPPEQQRIVERMERVLASPDASQRPCVRNEAWPTGAYELLRYRDDQVLAGMLSKDIRITASDLCDTICSTMLLLEKAHADATSQDSQLSTITLHPA